jgi:glycosyltransferase involved in cell wall biosynthesis
MISYSILISTYNQKVILGQSLESLRRQIKNPKVYEVIIADDCSTDGTDEFVKRLRYPIFLKYARAESNQGRARNRDRGFQKAMGRWVICLDGDMVPGRNFIEAYAHAWEEHPDAVLVGGFQSPAGWKVSPTQRYFLTRGRLAMERGARIPGRYFTSGNFSIRKDIYDKLSGFDLAFEGWGGEDTDFGLRLEQGGIPTINIPDASCFHHDSTVLEDIIKRYFEFGRGGYPRLLRKHPGETIFGKGWLLGLPDSQNGISRRLAAAVLWPLRTGPSLAVLRALLQFDRGSLQNDLMFDWLFYGNLARGYRKRAK